MSVHNYCILWSQITLGEGRQYLDIPSSKWGAGRLLRRTCTRSQMWTVAGWGKKRQPTTKKGKEKKAKLRKDEDRWLPEDRSSGKKWQKSSCIHMTWVIASAFHCQRQETRMQSDIPENGEFSTSQYPYLWEQGHQPLQLCFFVFNSWLRQTLLKIFWIQVIISQNVNSYYEPDTQKNTLACQDLIMHCGV